MEVQKCLEYYFERDITKEKIMQYIDKNIEELKKISKIRGVEIQIRQNTNQAQKVIVVLTIKRKKIKEPETAEKTIKKLKKVKVKKEKKTEITNEEKPIKKYGAYKEGGKFVPYQEKKKKNINAK